MAIRLISEGGSLPVISRPNSCHPRRRDQTTRPVASAPSRSASGTQRSTWASSASNSRPPAARRRPRTARTARTASPGPALTTATTRCDAVPARTPNAKERSQPATPRHPRTVNSNSWRLAPLPRMMRMGRRPRRRFHRSALEPASQHARGSLPGTPDCCHEHACQTLDRSGLPGRR
jgi:hypothetical protein